MPYFKLVGAFRQRALAGGAVEATEEDFVDAVRSWRSANIASLDRSIAEQLGEAHAERVHVAPGGRFEVMPITEQEFSQHVEELRGRLAPKRRPPQSTVRRGS